MARPPKKIDAAKVRRLTGMGLTVEEVAAILDCSKDTLERRFAASLKGGREHLNASLKRRQFMVAEKGNVTMLIWLGKQYLGQSDKVEHGLRDLDDKELVAHGRRKGFLGGGGAKGTGADG